MNRKFDLVFIKISFYSKMLISSYYVDVKKYFHFYHLLKESPNMCNEYLIFFTNHPSNKFLIIDFTRDFFIKNFWI